MITEFISYTNKKSYLYNYVSGGTHYPHFNTFLVDKATHQIGIYMLNGLYLSPRVEMKFDLQVNIPKNVNDICNKAFGTCTTRRHKDLKTF